MDFNAEQKQAIRKKDKKVKKILVSAGAGSGKTAVLTERVIRIICDDTNPVDIDKLLIITFTKNAAAEMRERISDRLKTEYDLLCDSADTYKRQNIKKQLSLLNRASICTFDSFFGNVVRQHFYKVDIDPTYKIAGDESCRELSKLSDEVMNELFESKFEEKDDNFLMLFEFFCPNGYDTAKLKRLLLHIKRCLSSVPFPDEFIKTAISLYDTDGEKTVNDKISRLIKDYIKELAYMIKTDISKSFEIIEEIKNKYFDNNDILENKKFKAYVNSFCFASELIDGIVENDLDYDTVYDMLDEKIPPIPGGANKAQLELGGYFDELKVYRDNFKCDFLNELKGNIFEYDPEYVKKIIQKHRTITRALFLLYKEFDELYWAKKGELSVFSFSDINQLCIKIMLDENILKHFL